jgi:two-component system, NtrC family, sensor histidine kinase HydH
LILILSITVLSASFTAFRYSRSSVLKQEQGGLKRATMQLAREYTDKEEFAKQHNEVAPLANPDAVSSQEVLNLLARVVLQNYPGVEGGFYSTTQDRITGYSPPSGPGFPASLDEKDRDDEREALIQLARQAATSHQHFSQVFTTDQNIALLDAAPIPSGQGYSASVWTMKQLPELPGSNRFRAYVTFAVLALTALGCVVLTLLFVHNLQSGVQKLESGLGNLEANLSSQIGVNEEPDEIKRIASAINRLARTLQQKIESEKLIENRLRHAERLAALGRLVAGIAHEVRNPLATIRLRVQMSQQATDHPLVQESCGVALEEIKRLDGMVDRLLSFSRPVHLRREPTSLSRLVEQRLEFFRERALQNGVKICTNLKTDSQLAQVDPSRMAQVFDNLIQNAIEAMSGSGGNLCVNISSGGNHVGLGSWVYIEFNDTGVGIDTNAVGQIFDPFFTTKPTGTGLGLSICHELVNAHGGDIQIVSSKGSGTTVRVILPSGRETAGTPA